MNSTPIFQAPLPIPMKTMDSLLIINDEDTSPQKKLGRPKGSKDTLKRTRRSTDIDLPELLLIELHYAILEFLLVYRCLTTDQLLTLIFSTGLLQPGSKTYALKVIRLLFHAGYIFRDEIAQKPSEPRKPFVNWLDSRGAKVLAQRNGHRVRELDWKSDDHDIGSNKLNHMLMANAVRIQLLRSAQHLGLTISRWDDERTIQRTHRDDIVTVRRIISRIQPGGGRDEEEETLRTHYYPDEFFTLEAPGFRLHRFIEIDLENEPLAARDWTRSDFSKKIACSLAYFRQGHFQRRYQASGFGVLTLTGSEQRCRNLQQLATQMGALRRHLFGTFEQFFAAGIEVLIRPIWLVAGTSEEFSIVRPEDINAPAAL